MGSGDLLRTARLRAGLTPRSARPSARPSQSAIARWRAVTFSRASRRCASWFGRAGSRRRFGLANFDDSYDSFINDLLDMSPGERVADSIARELVYARIRGKAVA